MDRDIFINNIIDHEYGTYIGNGTLGVCLYGSGFANMDNKPAPCYMAGLYSEGLILPIPSIGDLRFEGFSIDSKNYTQCLNTKDASLTSRYTIFDSDKKVDLDIKFTVLRLKDKSNKILVTIKGISDFTGDLPLKPNIEIVHNAEYNLGHNDKYSVDEKMIRIDEKTFKVNGDLFSDRVYIDYKFFFNGKESSSFYVEENVPFEITYISEVSRNPVSLPKYSDIDELYEEHLNQWAELWKTDIILGNEEEDRLIHLFLFYLLCSASEDYSIPCMGLSNDFYKGHIFWDAEIWMYPALLMLYPQFAKAIIKFRIKTLPDAMKNAKEHNLKGAEYGWETAQDGRDLAAGTIYSQQRHNDSDIAFSIWQYYIAHGDKDFLRECYPVLREIANYWVSKAELIDGKYEIRDVMPPNEYAEIINNSVYTNASAQIALWIATKAGEILGEEVDPSWMSCAKLIKINVEDNRLKIYDEYNNEMTKQADAELLIYPYRYFEFIKHVGLCIDFEVFKNTYTFYKEKCDVLGPCMNSSAHTVIDVIIGSDPSEDFKASYKDFLRGPFNILNETRVNFEGYTNRNFMTGIGGLLSSLVFSKIKLYYYDLDKEMEIISSPWKDIKIKGLHYKGKVLDI